jgi:hypothetical protein
MLLRMRASFLSQTLRSRARRRKCAPESAAPRDNGEAVAQG